MSSEVDRFPLGSEAWCRLVYEFLAQSVSLDTDPTWSVSEEFVDGPPEYPGWTVRCTDGKLELLRQPRSDVDVYVTLDYEGARNFIRTKYGGDRTQVQAVEDDLADRGILSVRGDPAKLPDALVWGLHDYIADRTA